MYCQIQFLGRREFLYIFLISQTTSTSFIAVEAVSGGSPGVGPTPLQHVQAWLQDPDAYAAYKTENVLTECIQRPGELLFIPAGWGHATLNKKPTLAVANEFCSCKGACCGETCSATAALAGDDQSVLARVEQSNAENMAALQAALSEWRSRSLDLQ